MTELENLFFEIIDGDLTREGPSTLFIDGIDPDRLAWVKARFIPVRLVENSEAFLFFLIPTLEEGL